MMRMSLSLILMCTVSVACSQSVDTVFVGLHQTVTLAFPGPVSLVDIGKVEVYANGANQPLYHHQVQGELVMLKALQFDPMTTSLFIRFSQGTRQGYYSAVLAVNQQVAPEQLFLQPMNRDSQRTEEPSTDQPIREDLTSTPQRQDQPSGFEEQLTLLRAAKQAYRSVGGLSGDVIAGLYHMGIDEEAFYLRVELWNKSNLTYELAQMQILQTSDQTRGKFGSGPVLVDVKHMEIPAAVAAGDQGSLLFVLPLAVMKQVDKQSFLTVRIREQKGNRHISFKIPGKLLLKTPNLKS